MTDTPKQKVSGANKGRSINTRWRENFIQELARTSNVTKSAKAVGQTTSTVYRLRSSDPAFAQKWLNALWEGYVHLEMEVLRRLREGDLKTEGGDKYDFANAIRLLSAHRDNAAEAQAARRNVSAAEVRASIDKKVEQIRSQVLAEKQSRAVN
ncbi:hypothetical protein ACRAQ6_05185 [Erythrobacter sp. HA6-11]